MDLDPEEHLLHKLKVASSRIKVDQQLHQLWEDQDVNQGCRIKVPCRQISNNKISLKMIQMIIFYQDQEHIIIQENRQLLRQIKYQKDCNSLAQQLKDLMVNRKVKSLLIMLDLDLIQWWTKWIHRKSIILIISMDSYVKKKDFKILQLRLSHLVQANIRLNQWQQM